MIGFSNWEFRGGFWGEGHMNWQAWKLSKSLSGWQEDFLSTTYDEHPMPFYRYWEVMLRLSTHIPAGGSTATTRRLSIPSGKGSGDFQAGYISDDTNPLTLNLGNNRFTEFEWCVQATEIAQDGGEVEFRVIFAGNPLNTYSQTPTWTLGTPAVTVFGWFPDSNNPQPERYEAIPYF